MSLSDRAERNVLFVQEHLPEKPVNIDNDNYIFLYYSGYSSVIFCSLLVSMEFWFIRSAKIPNSTKRFLSLSDINILDFYFLRKMYLFTLSFKN